MFQEKARETEGVAECVAALGSSVDIESSCGFLTLVTVPNSIREGKKKRGEKAKQDINASDSKQEVRESSPDGAELNSSNAQLLEEELDNIDSPMAGEPNKTNRPQGLQLQNTAVNKTSLVDNWKLLELSYGVPLFDMELNSLITTRINEGELIQPESLSQLRESSENIKNGLLHFIRENRASIPDGLDDEDVPFPTNPVWFDGSEVKPVGPLYNR